MRTFSSLVAGVLVTGLSAWGGTLSPPNLLHVGDATYPSMASRQIQMVSSLAVTEKGRIWAIWYAGPTPREDDNNYLVLATSADDGATWREVLVVDPDGLGPVRAYDPEVWLDPQGRLWMFWAQAVRNESEAQLWAMTTEHPSDANPVWTTPRRIAPGVMMCKPTVLSNGEWLLPISDWEARRTRKPDGATGGAWISTDQGRTFTLRGAALVPVKKRSFDEHMVVERKNGNLWMLLRTVYGIGESVSTDQGKTWPDVTPSSIPHTSARFFIRRLNSGNLLLVKHGPMANHAGRSHLTAFISKDDGATWEGGLLLDERGGISYPDGQETAQGVIYITYDYSRTGDRTLHMATFTEADAQAGKDVSGKVRLRLNISHPSSVPPAPTAP